ncbi:zinc finger protein 800-like isoform X11 [Tachypleus tridentatus]|uniref:zinc finger protein 800-like isoform X11 n=1 Tax=Tachypleus tridentatus TaxID=6853 RepID=UPI003FD60328
MYLSSIGHFPGAYHGREKFHRYLCPVCRKQLTTKLGLQRHLEIHAPVRNLYQCVLCKRNFLWRHDLLRHLRISHNQHDE